MALYALLFVFTADGFFVLKSPGSLTFFVGTASHGTVLLGQNERLWDPTNNHLSSFAFESAATMMVWQPPTINDTSYTTPQTYTHKHTHK